MGEIVKLNDVSSHGGKIIQASGNFTVDGVDACVDGDLHQCPINGHGVTPVTSTSSANANGKGIIISGDKAGCGAEMIGSGTATIG